MHCPKSRIWSTPIPFTPFHFGPGVLVKACGFERFWLTSFVLANILIDAEALYWLSRAEPPIHRHLHTYVGGFAAGLVAGLLMFGISQVAGRVIPARWQWIESLPPTPRRILIFESLVAGVIGGISHIVLDSFMHHDMNPFWPFSEGNALAGRIGVGVLHIGLAISGFLGVTAWLFLRGSKQN